jgi:hypothetical protein
MQIILEVPDRLGEKLQRLGDEHELCSSSHEFNFDISYVKLCQAALKPNGGNK